MSPIIGVAACRHISDYLESLRRAGGTPRVIDLATDVPRDAVGSVHGLLLTGGNDVDPARYGETGHAAITGVDAARDEFEIALVHAAAEAKLPIFGICRGMQVLNVALGGNLIQDIDAELPGSLAHAAAGPQHAMAHEVWITRGSLLWTLMQEQLAEGDSCAVNSRHHQAVNKPACSFEVSATAPDGVIEAIECASGAFCLGVQWHPENFWRTGEFRSLFEGFIQACRPAK
jgi:putative glutamine amidotransferase